MIRVLATGLAAAAASFVAAPAAPAAPLLPAGSSSSFARLQARLGGSIGLTVSPVGRTPPIIQLGSLNSGVAWSTIKVPIALAAVRKAGGAPSEATRSLMRRALTASDNAAAEALWSQLGPPASAGRAVESVLASAGDAATTVQTRRVRAGYTAFGQTRWTLGSQQVFIAGLPCLRYANQVLSLMGEVIPSQRWGLGSAGLPAQFKGGWGPDPSGRYLVRQMGILRGPGGAAVAVTIASIPADGGFASGTSDLSAIARWLRARIDWAAAGPPAC